MNSAMDRFQEEAKAQGITIPPILQQMDPKTGLPSVLTVDKSSGDDEAFKQKIQAVIDQAEDATQTSAYPLVEAVECEVQTMPPLSNDRSCQTIAAKLIDSVSQSHSSALRSQESESQTAEKILYEAQTETIIDFASIDCQTDIASYFDEATQITPKTACGGIQTQLSAFNLEESFSQTEGFEQHEADIQTLTEGLYSADSECQTLSPSCRSTAVQSHLCETIEDESQTTVAELADMEVQTKELQTREQGDQSHLFDLTDSRCQTNDPPELLDLEQQTTIIELTEQDAQTEVPYPKRKSAELSNLDKLKQAFQKRQKEKRSYEATDIKLPQDSMAKIEKIETSLDLLGDDSETDEDEETSDESLQWDPIDGRHAERQRPVTSLRQMFESGQTLDTTNKPASPPGRPRTGSRPSISRVRETRALFDKKE